MFLGVDAGGTKTQAILFTARGEQLAVGRYGTGNWESIGVDAALALYEHIVTDLCRTAKIAVRDITSAGWGLAGLDWPSDELRLRPGIEQCMPHATHTLVNDAFLALRAGSTRPYGVAAIAGTGSTVAAMGVDGKQARTFGLGSEWGDFDGAQQLTRAAFRVAARAHYGIGQETTLTQALLQWARLPSIPSLAEAYSRGDSIPDIATFAPHVMQCADHGDVEAQRILTEAGSVLAQNIIGMAHAVALRSLPFDVVLAGGVATGGAKVFHATIQSMVQAQLPLAHIVVLQRPPVLGAVLLAMDAVGCRTDLTSREW
jgi:N-acetylglucosamine kinase-like BadF-type ATPase